MFVWSGQYALCISSYLSTNGKLVEHNWQMVYKTPIF